MSESCKDTNIPSVDETALECCEIHSTNCIVTAEAVPCLKTGKGATLTKLFSNLCIVIKDIYSKLTGIDTTIEGINTTVGDINTVVEGNSEAITEINTALNQCSNLTVSIASSANTLTATVSGGEAPYTYLWKSVQGSHEGHLIDGVDNDSTLSTTKVNDSGVLLETESDIVYSTLFKLVVTDDNGCVKEEYFMHTEKETIII